MTQQGQPVLYRTSSTGFHAGIIAGNITNGGNTADVLAFSHGNDWEDTGNDKNSFITPKWGVDKGSSVGQWVEWPDPITLAALSDTFTVTTPSRTLGSAFQPSSTRPVLVGYSVRIASALSLSGGQAGRIELRSDSSATPTTVRARIAGGSTGTVVVGVSLSDLVEGQFCYLVKPGDFVLLQSVNETGTPTYTLTSQWEIVL